MFTALGLAAEPATFAPARDPTPGRVRLGRSPPPPNERGQNSTSTQAPLLSTLCDVVMSRPLTRLVPSCSLAALAHRKVVAEGRFELPTKGL
jgi:hypothetical protein